MAISFISVKCPECGATLEIEEERKQIFCSYCGTKIMIQNDNEHIYRHVDEAKVKQAEADKIIKLKQLEMEEKKQDAKERKIKLKIKFSIILAVIGFVLYLLGEFINMLTGNDIICWFGLLAFLGIACIWIADDKNK